MHSSWYSRRRIEEVGNETSSGAVAGAKVASRCMPIVEIYVGRSLRHAIRLNKGVRCMPHVA